MTDNVQEQAQQPKEQAGNNDLSINNLQEKLSLILQAHAVHLNQMKWLLSAKHILNLLHS